MDFDQEEDRRGHDERVMRDDHFPVRVGERPQLADHLVEQVVLHFAVLRRQPLRRIDAADGKLVIEGEPNDVIREFRERLMSGVTSAAEMSAVVESARGGADKPFDEPTLLSKLSRLSQPLPAKVRAVGWADVSRAYLRWGDLETANATKLSLYEKGQAAGKKGQAIDPKHTDAQFWAAAS